MATDNVQLGEILRAAREAAGISLARFAKLTTFSSSYVCNLEKGRKEIHPWIIDAYERVVGTQGLLAAGLDGDDMQRRAVLAALGTVTSLGIADRDLLAEALRVSLTAGFDADDWAEVTETHGQRFMTSPPSQARAVLAKHLMVLSREIRNCETASVRHACAKLMTLHGMATANLGDVDSAASWYRSARLAADRAHDPHLAAWVQGRQAFRRGYEGAEPREVLHLALGVEVAEAHLAAAQAHARIGDTTSARQAIAAACRAYEHADQSEGTIYAVQPWRFALSVAYVHALLGEVNQSEDLISQIKPPSTMLRWQAQLDMHRAVLLAKTGDKQAARDLAERVMATHPTGTRSVLINHMAEEVARATAQP